MNIAIIGTGYVGLVTGVCLADRGNHVICVDVDEQKVFAMKGGKIPIYEPGLEEIFKENIQDKRLFFTTSLEEAFKESHLIFLALPTPSGQDGSADLSHVLDVAQAIGKSLKEYKVIVNKSTVPVGTSEKVRDSISQQSRGAPFDVVSNPEFLREGFAVEDFQKPSRIIIGSGSECAVELMRKLYKPYTDRGIPLLVMKERSAELTKYAANAFLATKITFINEMANFCDLTGADIDSVRLGMGYDGRIGHRFLFPGIGYGGSCFPKDVKALISSGKELGYDFQILQTVEAVNKKQKVLLADKLLKYFKGSLKDKKIALWGLSFKANTDDIREASSLDIIEKLLLSGAKISAFDPVAMNNVKKHIGKRIHYTEDMYEALSGAHALLILTEWSEFSQPDFKRILDKIDQKVIFDGRNLLDPKEMKDLGFYYEGIGRKINR
ncbi:UDP-glucose dehydrogenase family protein [Bacteroidetes bacterium endosymbiont of Geopemphigus sp.]|uniref:UDP-glucose dehydrogenase family protein n=1 Tax=Bacteroidetes bacterium endosymbiont of Geopemphigus sp. TaxID=2047937 RepID=UPI000CD24C92|nr:UDP-glucose/GDP-mannose dehydrogenase family protein [Bacteroidetes bacterium endosymbiont of Geopemphigus sp.]